MKKMKRFFHFLALCLNMLNLVLLILACFVAVPAWIVNIAAIAEGILTVIHGVYDCQQSRNVDPDTKKL